MSMDTSHPTPSTLQIHAQGDEKTRQLSISSSRSAIYRSPVPDIEARGESKLSPTTDQQTVQTICASAMLLYERSVRPAYTMDTLSTEYQRPPQPRIVWASGLNW
ncbi:MAG TPA: hypothetical protein VFV38_42565 [Ktedonobacteraceae bacterium]|nr:hypothetical protein [Ktedonobacteraceae bacterium]